MWCFFGFFGAKTGHFRVFLHVKSGCMPYVPSGYSYLIGSTDRMATTFVRSSLQDSFIDWLTRFWLNAVATSHRHFPPFF